MRQCGIIAAAGIVAIERGITRLAEDHATAQKLAQGLASIPGIIIDPDKVQTNIVVFEPPTALSATDFIEQMNARGVKLTYFGGSIIRAVTHRMVNITDIDEVLVRIEGFVKE